MAKRREDYGGSVYDRQYFTDDELREAAEVREAAARGETDWTSAHDAVERTRAKYGYSGGADGSGYQKLAAPLANPGWDPDGTASAALDGAAAALRAAGTTYADPYADEIAAAKDALVSRPAFSYDYESDPAWQAYKKEYAREGRRAGEDTLGRYAAMTGGMPSTAAVTAAQQAGDYYAAKLTDKIPELYKLAYSMYADEGDALRGNLSALIALSDSDYGRWGDAYRRLADRVDTERALYRDYAADARAERDYADAAAERDMAERLAAAKLMAGFGDYSGYDAIYGTDLQGRADARRAAAWSGAPAAAAPDEPAGEAAGKGISETDFIDTQNAVIEAFDRDERTDAIRQAQSIWPYLDAQQRKELEALLRANRVSISE